MNILGCLLVYVDDYCIIGHMTLQHASKNMSPSLQRLPCLNSKVCDER